MAERVELLWWDGCPSSAEAHELVRRAMSEAGLDPDSLASVEIDTDEAAARAEFVGSPTVRIDGADVQPPEAGEPVGLSCRVYRLRDGRISPLPDVEDIKEALTR